MENSIRINSNKLQLREYNGQRVVMFKDIDTVHERKDGTAKRNFYTNRERFVEGVDFFKITQYEFRTAFGATNSRQQNDVIVLTESGYLMLAKSFTDDLAWKVQRELVNNYFRGKSPEPEQLTLETAEYHYFPKTFKGEPVITIADFVHFTEVTANSVHKTLYKYCDIETDYVLLTKRALITFRSANHYPRGKQGSSLIVIKKSGVEKLLHYYDCMVEIPMIEEKKPVAKPQTKRTANEILDEHKITHNDCIIALDVLRRIERNCENNVKMAEREGRSTKLYNQGLSEVKNVIKGVGMLLVMGY